MYKHTEYDNKHILPTTSSTHIYGESKGNVGVVFKYTGGDA